MRFVNPTLLFCVALAAFFAHAPHLAADPPPPTLAIDIDASDLPRKLLSAKITLPCDGLIPVDGADLGLWYPKWVPGSHGPGGPVANVAGLRISDSSGHPLLWQRAVGEFYKVVVRVPRGTSALHVDIRYITNQPTSTSSGHDTFGSALLGFVSANTVLMYPEGIDLDTTQVAASIALPEDWVVSTALHGKVEATGGSNRVTFQPISLRTFVDSPMMCGRYRKVYDLVEPGQDRIPPHRLHIFSECESVLDVNAEILQRMRQMVTQAARLFASHPFDEFQVLLATTDVLPRNGLEHASSTFNVLGQRSLQDPANLKGWDRLLVPHEYIHAWCGKYRRPKGMVTTDYHTDKATDLLWVYEGLTQYLGEVIEARCGFMTADEFRQRLAIEIRAARLQQGRDWRSLTDTGACSQLLRDASSSWPRLRRSQDYYMEGMMFWLEVDAIIRGQTGGKKSLDNFCRTFFQYDADRPGPLGFTRGDIVEALNQLVPYDWDGLIKRRIESPREQFDPVLVELLGYRIAFTDEKPDIPDSTFRYVTGIDALDSLGAVFSDDGTVSDLLLDSPAHSAKLGPGMKVTGVNGHAWSVNRMEDAIKASKTAREDRPANGHRRFDRDTSDQIQRRPALHDARCDARCPGPTGRDPPPALGY